MTHTPPSSSPQGWNPPGDPTAPPSPYAPPQESTPAPPVGQAPPSSVPPPPPADPALAWQASPPKTTIAPGGYPVPGPMPPQAPQAAPVGWMFGIGGVVLVLVLAFGAVLWFTAPSPAPITDPDASSSPTAANDPTSDPADPPAADLVTDPTTGLSFGLLPAPWSAAQQQESVGFSIAVGQQFLTEERWAAVILVGELTTEAFGYEGPDDLAKLADDFATITDQSNYGDGEGNPLKGLKRDGDPVVAETTVGDFPALTMEYHLSWTDTLVEDKGETLLFTVIDMGDGRAAGFLASVPDRAGDQLDAVRAAMAGLQFV